MNAKEFKERRAALLADHDLRGPDFARAYSALADEWVRELLGDEPGVTLVALGGYGRGGLCPHSDLDILLLHDGRRDVAKLAASIWYPIWDSGVRLDHSARTMRDTLRLARSELKVAMGLLDARPVAGPVGPAHDLRAKATAQWQEHGRRWLGELGRSTWERHESFGDLAFLLEPDLKEAKGGLRDITALRAAAVAAPFAVRSDLGADGVADLLCSARVLQAQDDVATALDYPDADALMAAIADGARRLAWLGDDAWRRVVGWLEGPRGPRAGRDRPLGPGLVLRSEEVRVVQPVEDADDGLTLRAAAEAARHHARISHDALAFLEGVPSLPDPWPVEARRCFLDLLASEQSLVELFEALDHYGVWTRLIPEWEPVRSRPQRNAYHRYTVDRHLVETTRNAAGLVTRVERPDLLLVGALLHDIGKGYPGDHSEVGADLAGVIGARVGFPPEDVEILQRLVRLHLLLPDIASRRDLDDPGTIDSVVTQVVDVSTLELLAALTEADSRATGDSAWTPWRQTLLADLVERVRRTLAGEPHSPTGPEHHHRLLGQAGGEPLVRGEKDSVEVVAPDHPGVLSTIAGVLSVNGLDVVTATAGAGRDGMVVDSFRVESIFSRPPDWARVEHDLRRALAGELSVEARLGERALTYGRRRGPQAATPAETGVVFDNDLSEQATVVEVRAPDTIGLLYRITAALAELHLDIRHATVSTVGHQAVDGFYVVDESGEKLTDPERIREVDTAIRRALDA